MKHDTETSPLLAKCAEVPVNRAFGHTLHFHLTAEQTGGLVTMFTDIAPPGGGPPPHFHLTEDEWWFVLEGEAEYFDGVKWTRVAPGGVVFSPRHANHTFRNCGKTPMRHLTHTLPGGFERFFQCCHESFARDGSPAPQVIAKIGDDHGVHFYTLPGANPPPRETPNLPSLVVQREQGLSLHAFGEEVIIMLGGKETGGQFTCFVDVTPPDGGPPPHWHEREDEWFHVLEGCVSFYVEGCWCDAHPGDSVFAPRGSVHTFKNNTSTPTRMLVHTSPSGFEDFYAEAAAEFARPGGPDMQRAIGIAGKYGINFA